MAQQKGISLDDAFASAAAAPAPIVAANGRTGVSLDDAFAAAGASGTAEAPPPDQPRFVNGRMSPEQVQQRIAQTKAGMATQDNLTQPDGFLDSATKGVSNMVSGAGKFLSGQYMTPNEGPGAVNRMIGINNDKRDISKEPITAPGPRFQAPTVARGIGAYVAPNHVQAPSDDEWQQAQEEAGANLAGMVVGAGAEGVAGGIKALPERLQTAAASNRAAAASGMKPSWSDPAMVAAGEAIGGHTGAAVVEGANLIRRTPGYLNAKAGLQERVARGITNIADRGKPGPVSASLPEPQPLEFDSSRTPSVIRAAAQDEARRSASWQEGADKSTTVEPQQEGRFATPKPTTPEHIQNELDSSRKEMEYENTPQLETAPAAEPKQPMEFDASTVKSEPKPPDLQKVEENLTRGKTAPAKGAKALLQKGTEADQRPLARRLVEALPEMADAKPGADHDAKLYKGYQTKLKAIQDAQANVPDGTTVPQDPIVDGFEGLVNEYKAKGNEAAAANVQKVWDKFASLDEDIPYDQFRDYKRSFFDAKRGSFSTPEMRRAYGVLMEAESQISPELSKANKEYSTVREAMDSVARMDTGTGRRFTDVGKVKPPTKPPVPHEEPPQSRRFNAPL